MPKWLNSNKGNNLTFDIRYWLAKYKTQLLFSNVEFKYNKQNAELNNFFTQLQNQNDLLQIMKTSEIQNSLFGKSYVYFDLIFNLENNLNVPKFGIYEYNEQNECLKINGLDPIYIKAVRNVLSGTNSINCKIWEFRIPGQIKTLNLGQNLNDKIPLQMTSSLNTPKAVKALLKNKTIKLPKKVMTAFEIQNKEGIEFSKTYDEMLADDYSVRDLVDTINLSISRLHTEIKNNRTRAFGSFSAQDQNQLLQKRTNTFNPFYKADTADLQTETFFIKTRGQDAGIEIQQTNFSLQQEVEGLNALIELYAKGCGLDINLTKDGIQKTNDEISVMNQTSYETIKATTNLRIKQWTNIIEKAMDLCGLNPFEVKGEWRIIIRNELNNDKLNNLENLINLYNTGLITQSQALQKINPELSSFELDEIKKELDEEIEKNKNAYNSNELFGNQDKVFENYSEQTKQNENNGEEVQNER